MRSSPHVRQLAAAVASRPTACASLLLNADIDGTRWVGGLGAHLKSTQVMSLRTRPLRADRPVAASCHNAAQLKRAVGIGVDFVTLSPAAHTDTHPNATPLRWQRFHGIVDGCPIPVYALGGVSPNQVGQ